ncbi:MAG: hypothetical protein RLZZ28_32 [Bacteroidota bacterium]|jgi:uncharacterized protein (TIGR00730 family)
MQKRSVTVFCGSRAGKLPDYLTEAAELGKSLAAKDITLVYGGGNKGMMGEIANNCLANGGKVIGIIPKILLKWEAQHEGLSELIVVEDMHERKKLLYELGDSAVVMPGGNGTLDELFEMLTWNTLNIHNKKIMLLNTGGFYDHLIAHMQTMLEQEYLYSDWRERLVVCNTAAEIISALLADTPQNPL